MMYNIEFSKKDLEILDEALTNLPYKKVFELINKINEQIFEHDLESENNSDDE